MLQDLLTGRFLMGCWLLKRHLVHCWPYSLLVAKALSINYPATREPGNEFCIALEENYFIWDNFEMQSKCMEETRAACEILDSGKKGRRKDVDLSENLWFLLYISLEEESHKLDSKISWQLADFTTTLHFKSFFDAHQTPVNSVKWSLSFDRHCDCRCRTMDTSQVLYTS